MLKIVIVMPAWNEFGNIKKMISELVDKHFKTIKADMHLLVVDNNSHDGTQEYVEKVSKTKPNVHFIQQGDKSGLGWAYVRGFQFAVDKLKADAVMEMDADFQHPPEFVKPMVEAYLNGADYVIGSRYVAGGSIPKEWAIPRKLMSYFGNLFARIVLTKFSIHDMTTGFRLTKVNGVLDKIELEKLMNLDRFAYKIDLLYQSYKNAKKVVEVPLRFDARSREKSKFNFKELVVSYMTVVVLGIKDKMKFIKFAVVGGTGFVVNFVFLRIFRNFGLSETLVWLFATELAIVNNFVFNNIWTFKEEEIKGVLKTLYKFLQFNLTSAGALLIQSILGPLGVRLVGEKYDFLVLAVVVGFVVLPYNYIMYNAVIWRTWKIPLVDKLLGKREDLKVKK